MMAPLRRALGPLLICLLVALPATPGLAESKFDREVALLGELLGLAPGSVVADIGAGDGDYALALAGIVGAEGIVYATELDEQKLAALKDLPQPAGGSPLRAVEGRIDGTGLEPGCCDAVFLRDVYHHITDPEPFMASLFATVRPGGRLVLIDFPPTFWLALFTPDGIPENRGGHGIRPELLIEEAEAAGFVPLRTVEKWPSSNFITRTYAVAFERPELP